MDKGERPTFKGPKPQPPMKVMWMPTYKRVTKGFQEACVRHDLQESRIKFRIILN